jgi:hypothetical protein
MMEKAKLGRLDYSTMKCWASVFTHRWFQKLTVIGFSSGETITVPNTQVVPPRIEAGSKHPGESLEAN